MRFHETYWVLASLVGLPQPYSLTDLGVQTFYLLSLQSNTEASPRQQKRFDRFPLRCSLTLLANPHRFPRSLAPFENQCLVPLLLTSVVRCTALVSSLYVEVLGASTTKMRVVRFFLHQVFLSAPDITYRFDMDWSRSHGLRSYQSVNQ